MAANPGTQERRRQRLVAVERLHLLRYTPLEIYHQLKDEFGVTRGTIRNDVAAIRKAWGADLDAATELEGRTRYLASTVRLRRLCEQDETMGAHEIAMAHKLDQELARLHGVSLKADEKTIHLDMQAARSFIDEFMDKLFEIITDDATRKQIIELLQETAARENRGDD